MTPPPAPGRIGPDIVRQFGRALRRHRGQHRWSQERLAAAAELNRSYVGELERGEAVASLQTAHKLASALGVSLGELLLEAEALPLAGNALPRNLMAIAG